jgi:hypothetical protein
MVGTLVTVITALSTKTLPWLRAKLESRSVSKSLGATLFTSGSIYRSIRYYIPPFCQSMDPAGGEESRLIHPVQNKLFTTLDNVLDPSSKERYHFLLADSGMGKTSALINYYVRHLRRWRKGYKLAVVPLGIPDADDKIKAIEDKPNTVLFLDALDEDTLAMVDHVERLRMLLKDTREFPRLLVTCRTQFFNKDEEIPSETGVLKIFDRPAGESAGYRFIKIYLTPFSDKQVTKYLRAKYPLWRWRKRRKAQVIVKKIPQLTARPMLLSHIDSLLNSKRHFLYSYELYEEMVKGWIEREKGFVEESEQLRHFSEQLAVDFHINRRERGGEFVAKEMIKQLAKKWGVTINEDKLSGRGLLNRDAIGNFKFAHRSIMEYLFVENFRKVAGNLALNTNSLQFMEWTDQMKTFFWEMLESGYIYSFEEISSQTDTNISLEVVGLRKTVIDLLIHRLAMSQINWSETSSNTVLTLLILLKRILTSGDEGNTLIVNLYTFNGKVGLIHTNKYIGFAMCEVEKEIKFNSLLQSMTKFTEKRPVKDIAFVPSLPVLVDGYNVNKLPSFVFTTIGAFKISDLIFESDFSIEITQIGKVAGIEEISSVKIEGTDILIPLFSPADSIDPLGLIFITDSQGKIFNSAHLEMITSIFNPEINSQIILNSKK